MTVTTQVPYNVRYSNFQKVFVHCTIMKTKYVFDMSFDFESSCQMQT